MQFLLHLEGLGIVSHSLDPRLSQDYAIFETNRCCVKWTDCYWYSRCHARDIMPSTSRLVVHTLTKTPMVKRLMPTSPIQLTSNGRTTMTKRTRTSSIVSLGSWPHILTLTKLSWKPQTVVTSGFMSTAVRTSQRTVIRFWDRLRSNLLSHTHTTHIDSVSFIHFLTDSRT